MSVNEHYSTPCRFQVGESIHSSYHHAGHGWSEAGRHNTDDAATIANDLKGIGMKKAELIVTGRKGAKYTDSEDLATRVKGIGPKTLEKNAGKIKF